MSLRVGSLVTPLKAVWKRFAQAERDLYARQVGAHGDGGSLARAVRRAKITVRRWGYIIRYWEVGQALTWHVRGTKERFRNSWRGQALETGQASTGRILAHPAASPTDVEGLSRETGAVASATIDAWDREAR